MLRGIFSIALLGLVSLPVAAQTVPLATAAARTAQRREQEDLTRPDFYDLARYPLTEQNERQWRKVLWATAVVEPQADYVDRTIAELLDLTPRRLNSVQKRIVELALQVGTQLYLSNPDQHPQITRQLIRTVETSNEPKWVGMALSALLKQGATPRQKIGWRDRVIRRFPNWRNDPHLLLTLHDMSSKPQPPLKDLLNWTIAPGEMQLYVLCPPGRTAVCQTLLKDRSGQFVQEQGRLWSVPLLARSLHGLPAVFSHGQSPQGLYRIEGTVPQPDTEFFRAYGLFPLVELFVPLEPGVKAFLPNQKGTLRGGLPGYQALLPPSWRNYLPIQESFWAGRAGRTLFRIHGTGEATNFFTNTARFPNTVGWNPAIGCLSALEQYDAAGRLIQADMPRVLASLASVGGKDFTGYLIVVETPNPKSVTLSLKRLAAQRKQR
jgi:hypothetical protein